MNIDKNTNNEIAFKYSWPLLLRGVFLVMLGISLFSINSGRPFSVLVFALFAIIAGIFGIAFTRRNKAIQIRRSWLIIESGADIILGVIFLFIYGKTDTIEEIRKVFAIFSLLFAFMQIIFIFQIAQAGIGVNLRMAVLRALMAVGYGLFGLILMAVDNAELLTFLMNCIGIGPIISGITNLNSANYLKRLNDKF